MVPISVMTTPGEGGVALLPLEARVTEEANGEYSLTLLHARDDVHGRHRLLRCGNWLRVRLPGRNVPLRHVEKTIGTVQRYRVQGTPVQVKRLVWQEGSHHAVYRPMTVTEYRSIPLYRNAEGEGSLLQLAHGETVMLLKQGMERSLVMTRQGIRGYAEKARLQYLDTVTGEVWQTCLEEARTGEEQLFRITQVTCENSRRIKVHAMHSYYECAAVELPQTEWINVPLQQVLDQLSGMNERIVFLSGEDAYVNGSYSGTLAAVVRKLCDDLELQLVREGDYAYLLNAKNTERCFTLDTRRHITACRFSQDAGEVYTRFIPYVNGEQLEFIYSPQYGKQPCEKSLILSCKDAAEASRKAEDLMRQGVDLPERQMKVSIAHGSLQGAQVFDRVRIVDTAMGIDTEAAICGLTYDPIRQQITSITLGGGATLGSIFENEKGSWRQ